MNDDGNVHGISDYKKLSEMIPQKIRNYLGIICDVNILEKDQSHYLEIVVNRHSIPISFKGEYFYRTGSTLQVLRGQSLNEFILERTGKSWDEVIDNSSNPDYIDSKAIQSFKQGALLSNRLPGIENDSDIEILKNLKILKNKAIKRAGIILFAKDPKEFFTSAFIKIGKFGKSDTELEYQDIIESAGYLLPEKTIKVLLNKYIGTKIYYDGLQRIEKPEYPLEGIREIIMNAIIHRVYRTSPIQISVYSDKITFWNEGELPEGITINDLKKKHPSIPRNPLLADICFKGGRIEAWGRGTLKIVEENQKAGLREPKFELIAGGFSVTMYKDIYNEESLKEYALNLRQKEAVLLIKDIGEITNTKYQEKFGVSGRTALRDLSELVELGLLERKGEKKGTFYILKK